eukprot:CAMPEP_0114280528 /NCGR_PEP_ID=MMETSP0059-20121206/2487_1 /TAXON_ID=36894 /ORGANISM="Pyramimonas parkeae, Strain CCMP726" /LENGTH=61 /DNA_ID=CAMNT_0001400937 /DNA_START=1172 /DNA_END=1357 /DNA_ORIENTATION=+
MPNHECRKNGGDGGFRYEIGFPEIFTIVKERSSRASGGSRAGCALRFAELALLAMQNGSPS